MARAKSDWKKAIDRRSLFKTLGFKGGKLPRNFEGVFENTPVQSQSWGDVAPWGKVTIVIIRTPGPDKKEMDSLRATGGRLSKSSAHRIFFWCECGKLIPVGRAHQHLPACRGE